ncbi:MAG: cytochrome b [Sphingomonadaceae bacterium]|nr:cytochrome b [Sphingomonadaceae bacterium]
MPERYTRVAIAFHWFVAILIVTNVALALSWPHVADESVRPLIGNHKSIGMTVLGLAIMRLLWRLTHRPPPYPPVYARWETRLAHWVHAGLYVLMFALPLSGWIMDSAWEKAADNPNYYFGLFEWPRIAAIMALDPVTKKQVHEGFGAAHEIAGYILYLLVFLHVAGALKHQLQGHRELARMGVGPA